MLASTAFVWLHISCLFHFDTGMDAAKCVDHFRVEALTGSGRTAEQIIGPDPDLAIQISGQWHLAGISGSKNASELLELLIPLNQFSPAFEGCIIPDDIQRVNVFARSHDEWFVASINISTVIGNMSNLLTSNPNLNKFLETDGAHTYDSINISLTRPVLGENCINTLLIRAQTGSQPYNTFSAVNQVSHNITFQLTDGRELTGELRSPAYLNELYESYLDFAHEFGVGDCVEISDIAEVRLVAGNRDGWFIVSIETQVRVGNDFTILTSDPVFNRWLDLPECNYDFTVQVLQFLHLCRTYKHGTRSM